MHDYDLLLVLPSNQPLVVGPRSLHQALHICDISLINGPMHLKKRTAAVFPPSLALLFAILKKFSSKREMVVREKWEAESAASTLSEGHSSKLAPVVLD